MAQLQRCPASTSRLVWLPETAILLAILQGCRRPGKGAAHTIACHGQTRPKAPFKHLRPPANIKRIGALAAYARADRGRARAARAGRRGGAAVRGGRRVLLAPGWAQARAGRQ